MKSTISILIPAYNEQISIEGTVKRIKTILKTSKIDYEIIVINDGSKDKTKQILSTINNITVINNPYNLGYGASLKRGLINAKGEYIVITDADGTYPVEDIPRLLKHHKHYDMVVGARVGKKVHIPFFRKPAKKFITFLANLLVKRRIIDLNSGLRIFRKDMAMKFYNLYPSGFSFTSTITLAAFTNDYTVKYIPINYYKRTGKSTISPIKDFLGFIALIFKIVLYFKPLRFFLTAGLLLTLAGIAHGIYQVTNFATGLGQLPIILVLGGMQIILLGIVADLIAKRI